MNRLQSRLSRIEAETSPRQRRTVFAFQHYGETLADAKARFQLERGEPFPDNSDPMLRGLVLRWGSLNDSGAQP